MSQGQVYVTVTYHAHSALLTLPVHRAFGASDPALARAFGASDPACDYRASRDPTIPTSCASQK